MKPCLSWDPVPPSCLPTHQVPPPAYPHTIPLANARSPTSRPHHNMMPPPPNPPPFTPPPIPAAVPPTHLAALEVVGPQLLPGHPVCLQHPVQLSHQCRGVTPHSQAQPPLALSQQTLLGKALGVAATLAAALRGVACGGLRDGIGLAGLRGSGVWSI